MFLGGPRFKLFIIFEKSRRISISARMFHCETFTTPNSCSFPSNNRLVLPLVIEFTSQTSNEKITDIRNAGIFRNTKKELNDSSRLLLLTR